MIEAIFSRVKVILLKLKGAKISSPVRLNFGVQVHANISRLTISNNVSIDRYTTFILTTKDCSITLDDHVYINRFTLIDCSSAIHIKKNTMIGSHCYITDHDHSYKGLPANTLISDLPLHGSPTIVGENVWIGSHVTLLKGVSVGKNSIIGAGSVVTKSIPENSIAVGNPCRVIKQRD